jgi:phosphate transport system substrate-binding protein
VSRDVNGLGFFGYSYYKENTNKLKALSVNGIFPSFKTIKDGTYKPLSRQLFLYVDKKIENKKEVKNFINFYLSHPDLISEVGYVPLKK